MADDTTVAIACTLTGRAYRERLEWIGRLNADGLRGRHREGRTLVLDYAPEVGDRVRELVRQEAECCSFLTFAIDESSAGLRLRITVPEQVGDAAEPLFDPFLV